MGFAFPGGTSPHGAGSSYTGRDRFPPTSSTEHCCPALGLHVRTIQGASERSSFAQRSPLLSLPAIRLISPGSGQDEIFAGLGCTGVIQGLPVLTEAAPPYPWGQNRSTCADSVCSSLFTNISKRYLNFSMKKPETAKF